VLWNSWFSPAMFEHPFFHRPCVGHGGGDPAVRLFIVEDRWLLARAHLGTKDLGG